MTQLRRVALSTGVTLNVATAGRAGAPAVVLLHGFPESHKTWSGIADLLSDGFRLIMPDQRGFGASDQPQAVDAYRPDILIEDIFALAEAMDIASFALVGHDWGGAIAWPAAFRRDPRLTRLAVVNAPHPLIFQTHLIEDAEQRGASQYITWLRNPAAEQGIAAMGFDRFFAKMIASNVDPARIGAVEPEDYFADWSRPGALTAMLNWYRASNLVVPPPGAEASLPDWARRAFPAITVPTLVVWGMRDSALRPTLLDGLDELVVDLTIHRIDDAGHFAPWETPRKVADALRGFLA